LSRPALADGEILITQAKALAGGVTTGDTKGFPVTLSKPGLYKLASGLAVPAGKSGIQVTASFVTIDLNGFALQGGGVALIGIAASSSQSITVRNGTITRFKASGIFGSGDDWIVEDMRVTGNGGGGIALTSNNVNGKHARILNNTVANNGGDGVNCGGDCLVQGNNISQNGFFGIEAASGLILGNNIAENAEEGIYSAGSTGFGNNLLTYNNGGGDQVASLVFPLQPNYCTPTAC
jgi:hypothetical protein